MTFCFSLFLSIHSPHTAHSVRLAHKTHPLCLGDRSQFTYLMVEIIIFFTLPKGKKNRLPVNSVNKGSQHHQDDTEIAIQNKRREKTFFFLSLFYTTFDAECEISVGEERNHRFIVNRKYCVFLSKLLFYVFHSSSAAFVLFSLFHRHRSIMTPHQRVWIEIPAMKEVNSLACFSQFHLPHSTQQKRERENVFSTKRKKFFFISHSSLVGQLLGVLSTFNVITVRPAAVADFMISSLSAFVVCPPALFRSAHNGKFVNNWMFQWVQCGSAQHEISQLQITANNVHRHTQLCVNVNEQFCNVSSDES